KWRKYVAEVVESLVAALEPDDVVLGGGNAKKLKDIPPGCRIGDNSNAFRGGFRLWDNVATDRVTTAHTPTRPGTARLKSGPAGRRARGAATTREGRRA